MQRSYGGASSSGSEMRIPQIPFSIRQQLCDHLDELDAWEKLAKRMSLRPEEIQSVRREKAIKNSPTKELLSIWGLYNHSVRELFFVLWDGEKMDLMFLINTKVIPSEYKPFIEKKLNIKDQVSMDPTTGSEED